MIAVTGAVGKLGQLVVQQLLEKMPAGEIVAAVRTPEKARHWAERGVQVREAEYAKPETLRAAFAGAKKVLLISSSELGSRIPQHQAVIEAAQAAGVQFFAYTSILHAETSTLVLAQEHKKTEEHIRAAGMPFVLLRNGWYMENHTGALASAIEHGAILGAAGDGRFAAAAREDYAAAAVAALTSAGHENKIYELGGDHPFTLTELAAEVSKQAGKPVVYRNLPADEYAAALTGFGLSAPMAAAIADADGGASRGELDASSHDLSALTGRPTATLENAVAAALSAARP